jgi:hypothetical protein
MTKTFCNWLEVQYPPSGKPSVGDFLAEALAEIDRLPKDEGPDVLGGPLDEVRVKIGLEWLFTALLKAHEENRWARTAIYAYRLLALKNIGEIVKAIVHPIKPIDSSTAIPTLPPPGTPRAE